MNNQRQVHGGGYACGAVRLPATRCEPSLAAELLLAAIGVPQFDHKRA